MYVVVYYPLEQESFVQNISEVKSGDGIEIGIGSAVTTKWRTVVQNGEECNEKLVQYSGIVLFKASGKLWNIIRIFSVILILKIML